MSAGLTDFIPSYLRELTNYRKWFLACYALIVVASIGVALTWPKSYTSYALIYADNSNVIQPLLESTAKATRIDDQSRMAREIIFKREYADEVLKAAGYSVDSLTAKDKEALSLGLQARTTITNIGGKASLIRIAFSDSNPVKAFTVAQKYTSLFIEESVVKKRGESKDAFDFIQSQVSSYQAQLQESEQKLTDFKNKYNYGTLADANARISRYKSDIETLELELVQLDIETDSVEKQLSGEVKVSKNLNEMASLRNRINALQRQMDTLLSRFRDDYPDVVQLQTQIDDLMSMYESGDPGLLIREDDLTKDGTTSLHEELRSRLAAIKTAIQTKRSQLVGLQARLNLEIERVEKINETDADRAELTRNYDVTRGVYNQLKEKLESARITVHLDEELQGFTFKVQESAAIPTQSDGTSFSNLLLGSFALACAVPIGILVLLVELDPRIRSESDFSEEWPPLLMVVPPLTAKHIKPSNTTLLFFTGTATIAVYAAAILLNRVLSSGKDFL
jgi:polysaccharide chain length determinant protein (PEP-CTERM system associated)